MKLFLVKSLSCVLVALFCALAICSCDKPQPDESSRSAQDSPGTSLADQGMTTIGPEITTINRIELYSHIARACDYVKSKQGTPEVIIKQQAGVLVAGEWARALDRGSLSILLNALRGSQGHRVAIRALPGTTEFSHGDSLGEISRGAWILTLVTDDPASPVMKANFQRSASGASR